MFASSLLSTLLLALAVAATPVAPVVTVRNGPVTLPISRRLTGKGVLNLFEKDLKRANALVGRHSESYEANVFSEDKSTPVDNQDVQYLASVGVGSPPTQCECSPDPN